MIRLRLVLPVALALGTGAVAQQGGPPPLPDAAALEEMLAAFDVPGIALAGVEGCEPAGGVEAGTADLGAGRPVAADTLFEAASLSKPVFAYLVMQLVDEGVVELDRPLAETLDAPRIADRAGYARITPRLVLSHRTGLPNWAPDRHGPLAFDAPPGTAYSYSGEAFELLRAHVEERTGRPLGALFRERLGAAMPRSAFGPPLPEGAAPARGYRSAADPTSGRGLTVGGAAGGLVTTARDYAAFLGIVCRGEGLSPGAHAAMLEPQSPVPPEESLAPTSWALGWGVMTLDGEVVVFHDGNNEEYRSLAVHFPASREGYVFLTNGSRGGALIEALVRAMQGG